ncbi:MAG: right-handed parallel beta-helix repeat-containing protein [Myxococcales bacterium]|nr:right-handed parallel beta-helix repeat-containing protein [Myxococcales bacterium]
MGDWTCVACTNDVHCGGGRRCETMRNECVQCVTSDDCGGRTPVCEGNVCRGCRGHGECAGGLCALDGSCPAVGQVVWVDGDAAGCASDGTVSGAGTRARPYCEIAVALMNLGSRQYVAVRDSARAYGRFSWTTMSGSVEIHGVEAGGSVPAVLEVGSANSVECRDGVLTMVGVNVQGRNPGSGHGVEARNCTLRLESATVSGAGGAGVSASGGSVTMRRVRVLGNESGVVLSGSVRYEIENSIIARNGTLGSSGAVGGVSLSAMATGRFVNNTVVSNQGLTVGGVLCGGGQAVVNSLLWGNGAMSAGSEQSGCMLRSSRVGECALGGMDGYHLTSGSTGCIGAASAMDAPEEDIDGERRPCGGTYDIGADEYCP